MPPPPGRRPPGAPIPPDGPPPRAYSAVDAGPLGPPRDRPPRQPPADAPLGNKPVGNSPDINRTDNNRTDKSSEPATIAVDAPSVSKEAPVRGQTAAAVRSTQSSDRTNVLAIWAMVLSVLGITSPVGLFLGYRARNQIRRTREYGDPFATVAIIVGWAYVFAVLVAIVAYLLVLVLG
ncbi:DUF4190 domain-containing protein [Gordonia sp. DT30]|uniref:DUF4190 domain-containing protein n=1 Tax=Gordonia sp. DT30 TaxID=3416546 RepID=UPI003CEA8787